MTYIVTKTPEIYEAYKRLLGSEPTEMVPKITSQLAENNTIAGYIPFFIAALAKSVFVGLPKLGDMNEIFWVVSPTHYKVVAVDESSFSLGETLAPVTIFGEHTSKDIFNALKKSRDLSISQQKNCNLVAKSFLTEEQAEGQHVISEKISYHIAAKTMMYTHIQNTYKGDKVPFYIAGRYKVSQTSHSSMRSHFRPAIINS